jgi:hypothetical protein
VRELFPYSGIEFAVVRLYELLHVVSKVLDERLDARAQGLGQWLFQCHEDEGGWRNRGRGWR